MKNTTTRTRLSAAVLAGAIAFTSFGLTAPASFAATTEAATYAETIVTTATPSNADPGWDGTEMTYKLDAGYTDSQYYRLTGENISTLPGAASPGETFVVTLTDQPQIITHLIAKHIDGLVGADKLITFENPLVVPAIKHMPAPAFDDRIVMPQVIMGTDENGYQTFSIDQSKMGTTSADLIKADRMLGFFVDGVQVTEMYGLGEATQCDYGTSSPFDGKTVEIRGFYTDTADGTTRYGSVFFDCLAQTPLSLKLTQAGTSATPGSDVAVSIDAEGTYGKLPQVEWLVDGVVQKGATGESFTTPVKFSAVSARVTVEDRQGEKLTKSIAWANPQAVDGGDANPEPTPTPGMDDGDKGTPGTTPGTDKTPAVDTDRDKAPAVDTDDKDKTPAPVVETDDKDKTPAGGAKVPSADHTPAGTPVAGGTKTPVTISDAIRSVWKTQPKAQVKPADRISNPRVMSALVE